MRNVDECASSFAASDSGRSRWSSSIASDAYLPRTTSQVQTVFQVFVEFGFSVESDLSTAVVASFAAVSLFCSVEAPAMAEVEVQGGVFESLGFESPDATSKVRSL